MGDMGDLFRGLRDHNRDRKAAKIEDFLASDLYRAHAFTQHTPEHYSLVIEGGRVDYWPSGSKWRFAEKTVQGDLIGFTNWLRKRTAGSVGG